jgi:hypothetical protein
MLPGKTDTFLEIFFCVLYTFVYFKPLLGVLNEEPPRVLTQELNPGSALQQQAGANKLL